MPSFSILFEPARSISFKTDAVIPRQKSPHVVIVVLLAIFTKLPQPFLMIVGQRFGHDSGGDDVGERSFVAPSAEIHEAVK